MEKTHLDKNIYYQIMGYDEKRNCRTLKGKTAATRKTNVSMRIVTSFCIFCIGVGASMKTVNSLLAAAGQANNDTDESNAYKFVMNNMHGSSIDECNEFLEPYGVELLGSKTYRPRKAVNE